MRGKAARGSRALGSRPGLALPGVSVANLLPSPRPERPRRGMGWLTYPALTVSQVPPDPTCSSRPAQCQIPPGERAREQSP